MSTLSHQKSPQKIPNGALGMSIFVVTETMLFMGFISAFSIVKAGSLMWPPANQPRLPVEMTIFSTVLLSISGICLFLSYKKYKSSKAFEPLFFASLLLGVSFVGLQGYEWTKLIAHGLTLTSSNYGGFFYLIIGAHAAHAICAILMMIKLYLSRHDSRKLENGFLTIQVFWYFVVGMWPFLYITVYL